MRILYIDHYAGSPTLGMEYRCHAMATQWARLGAETVLLAGYYAWRAGSSVMSFFGFG